MRDYDYLTWDAQDGFSERGWLLRRLEVARADCDSEYLYEVAKKLLVEFPKDGDVRHLFREELQAAGLLPTG